MKEPGLKTLETTMAMPILEKEVETNPHCLNCDHELQDNFCAKCGQMKYRRINGNYILAEIYNVFSTTGGFFYTLRKLVTNPGKTAREFIEGQRVNHFRPLYFAFVLSGFEALIAYNWVGFNEIIETYMAQQHMVSPLMHDIYTVMAKYHSFMMLLFLPVFALCTKLAFRRWGQNYYEHIVMNAYILSLHALFGMVFMYPLMYLFHDQIDTAVQILILAYLIIPFILTWFFYGFYPDKSLKSIVGHVFLIIGIMFVFYILLIVISMIFGIVYVAISGPEALEYIRPK